MDLAKAYYLFCTSTGAERLRASRLLMGECRDVFHFRREQGLTSFKSATRSCPEDTELLFDYLVHCAGVFADGGTAAQALGEAEPRSGRPRNRERDLLIYRANPYFLI